MSSLEKVIELIIHSADSPLKNFATTINKDSTYLKLKNDTKRWQRIYSIAYEFRELYGNDIYKEFKKEYEIFYPKR